MSDFDIKIYSVNQVIDIENRVRNETIQKCIDKIEEFAECNEECSKEFYYGQGCNACLFGKIKDSIRGEKGENN